MEDIREFQFPVEEAMRFASSRTMSFALAEGCRKSTGNGACSSRSPGQNQMAHQVSNAARSWR